MSARDGRAINDGSSGASQVHAASGNANRQAFIHEIIHAIQKQSPQYNTITIADLTHYFTNSIDANHPANLYRKSFGNINQIFHSDHELQRIFQIERDVVKLNEHMKTIQDAYDDRLLTYEDLEIIKNLNNAATQQSQDATHKPSGKADVIGGVEPLHSAEPGQRHGPLHGVKGGATSTVDGAQAVIAQQKP